MDKGQNFQGTNKSLKISSWTLLEVCFHQHKKVFFWKFLDYKFWILPLKRSKRKDKSRTLVCVNVDISNYMLHDQKVIFETIKIFQNWHMVNNTQTTVRELVATCKYLRGIMVLDH